VTAAISHRRAIAWLCIVFTLWLTLAAQRHALEHALHAMHAAAAPDEGLDRAKACEQCLQFAAVDAAAVSAPDFPQCPALGTDEMAHAAPALRADRFTAYGSRAPPRWI
jgi:hypothetical protein